MRRALWLLALTGCFDWTQATPAPVDAGVDAGKDAGDAGGDADGSLPCEVAAKRRSALACNPVAAMPCGQPINDECGCPIYVASPDSDATKAYQAEITRCPGGVCAPCSPSSTPWTCKDDGTGSYFCAP